jgi:hypothetical protein
LRWDELGRVVERPPEWSGVPADLIRLFGDLNAFTTAIGPLIRKSFIRRSQDSDTLRIEIPQKIQQFVFRDIPLDERLQWVRTTICIVSHVYPEDPFLESAFDSLRAKLNKHVFRCLEHLDKYTWEELRGVAPQLSHLLLAALGRSGFEKWLLNSTERLVNETGDSYYRCLAAKWRAYM